MAKGFSDPLLRFVRALAARGADEDEIDSPLLARFAGRGDADAFAALVRRHGPMVLGVCRRVLRDAHAAEDAFQVTFLLLARKARSLKRPGSLAPWLYGVAWRTAARLRSDAVRRRARERETARPVAVGPDESAAQGEVRPVLDDVIRRLPARYREPFVLCALEGKTHAEAARLLGCPRATVATRLTRARLLLQRWLTRRGLAPAVGLALANLTVEAQADLPPGLWAAAVETAVGGVAPSATVSHLLKGVQKMSWIAKIKFAAVVLLATAASAWTLAGGPPTAEGEAPEGGLTLRVPSGEPSAALLVAYLNDNARRVRTLECRDLAVDIRDGRQSVGLGGQLACQPPRRHRLILKLLGQTALDLGSNETECWYESTRDDGPRLRFAHKDLRKDGAGWPFPFPPDWLARVLGIAERDPAGAYEVCSKADTVELAEKIALPGGKSVRWVTVFHRAARMGQVAGYRLEGAGKEVIAVKVEEVWMDRASGAVLPRRLRLVWAAQKLTIKAQLSGMTVNAIEEERATRLFARPVADK